MKALRFVVLCFLSLFLLFPLSGQQTQESVTSKVDSLNKHLDQLHHVGPYADAEVVRVRVLELAESKLGLEHPDLAEPLSDLAELYEAQGAFEKALPLYQRALAITEKAFGVEHPSTVAPLDNLAHLYKEQGTYEKALPLYQRALAIREKALGPDHPATASSLNQLAALHELRGAYEEALPLCQRALAITEKTLGPRHPGTASSLNNLAGLYRSQGAYEKALPLYQRALAIREGVLGPAHPDTATSLNNLADLYREQGAYDKALPLYQRALAIFEKALIVAPDYPSSATLLNNLAELYREQGAYDKALPLYQFALAIREKALGPDHPSTATSLDNLAALYESQRAYEKALPLYQRALAIKEKALGPDHPESRDTVRNVRIALRDQAPGDASTCNGYGGFLTHERVYVARTLGSGWELAMRKVLGDSRIDLELFSGCLMSSEDAASIGTQIVLDTKARLLEELQSAINALARRSEPALKALLEEYFDLGRQLARLQLTAAQEPGVHIRDAMARAAERQERLREEILHRSPEFREVVQDVTLAQVREVLRPGQALVEVIRFREAYFPRRNHQRWGPARYGAFVVTSGGGDLARFGRGGANRCGCPEAAAGLAGSRKCIQSASVGGGTVPAFCCSAGAGAGEST